MTDERFEEIIKDKTKCEFCADLGDEDVCINCKKVTPISVVELKEFWQDLRNLITYKRLATSSCRKLAKYRKAEADGLLTRLRIPRNTIVYVISQNKIVQGQYITHVAVKSHLILTDISKLALYWALDDEFFLTREEAEQALKELEGQT